MTDSCCSICFGEYTASGPHQATSLKCGHLFGSECINRWLSIYKKSFCPTCSAPIKKSQLRLIYAPAIVAFEEKESRELIEKYVRETEARKELENEVSRLKSQLEVIRSVNSHEGSSSTAHRRGDSTSHALHMNFRKYCKIHFFPSDDTVLFDNVNQSVLISCCRAGEFGIFKYSLADFSIYTFIRLGRVRNTSEITNNNSSGIDELTNNRLNNGSSEISNNGSISTRALMGNNSDNAVNNIDNIMNNTNYKVKSTMSRRIRAMKISQFGDALCLVAYDNRVALINGYSDVVVKEMCFPGPVTAISFCKNIRNHILVGDGAGFLYFADLSMPSGVSENTNKGYKEYRVCKGNIHSLVEDGINVLVGCVFGVYSCSYFNLEAGRWKRVDESDTEDTYSNGSGVYNRVGVCTSLTVDPEGNILSLFRDSLFTVTALVLGSRFHMFDSGVKQYSRHQDMFFNGYLLITDDLKNRIKVFDRNSLQLVHSYSFKEKIVGFCGDPGILIVLTRRGVYLYDSK